MGSGQAAPRGVIGGSPCRLLEPAAGERALGWMNGCASEKLLAAHAVENTEHLVASPGRSIDLDLIGRAPAATDVTTVVRPASGAR